MLNFSATSEEGNQFEKTKQVKWINSLLASSNLVMSESFDNIPPIQCKTTPLVVTLDIVLNSSPESSLPVHLSYFLQKHIHEKCF